MTTDEKRAVLWCLNSEIQAFARELKARGGPQRDHYGVATFNVVNAHLGLLESARRAVEKVKVT